MAPPRVRISLKMASGSHGSMSSINSSTVIILSSEDEDLNYEDEQIDIDAEQSSE